MAVQNLHKGVFIGLYDVNRKPIHEGDVIRYRNFRAIVIFNEFENNWTMVHVDAYNDMQRHPYCRGMYLEDNNSKLSDFLIKHWSIQVIDNIYINPAQLGDDSMLAYSVGA